MRNVFLSALVFGALSTAAMAAEPANDPRANTPVPSGPIKMTDSELDNVAAGTLLTVTVSGNQILNNDKVGVNAAVSAAVAVLGGAASGAAAKLTQ